MIVMAHYMDRACARVRAHMPALNHHCHYAAYLLISSETTYKSLGKDGFSHSRIPEYDLHFKT